MIAYSDQTGADLGGETGGNMFMECCDLDVQGEETCTETIGGVRFPKRDCGFLGMAFGKIKGVLEIVFYLNHLFLHNIYVYR